MHNTFPHLLKFRPSGLDAYYSLIRDFTCKLQLQYLRRPECEFVSIILARKSGKSHNIHIFSQLVHIYIGKSRTDVFHSQKASNGFPHSSQLFIKIAISRKLT